MMTTLLVARANGSSLIDPNPILNISICEQNVADVLPKKVIFDLRRHFQLAFTLKSE